MAKHIERPPRKPVPWQFATFVVALVRLLLDLGRSS
jgi:hypothetical protein